MKNYFSNEMSHYKLSKFGQIKQAVRLAKKFHAGQVRKGPKGDAFYNHPRRVCKSYLAFKNKSISGVVAALCHDLVEDTPLDLDELGQIFGPDVRQIVFNLTKPDSVSSSEYAENFFDWGLESKKIKLCDIEDNILDSREIPLERRMRMLVRWKRYLDKLENSSPVHDLETELELVEKWTAVNKLHAEEWKGMKPDINFLRNG
jgi:GTP diphosphokinase / guanosine-3',5'-bis(diphosphate) 3'-diphosphatase